LGWKIAWKGGRGKARSVIWEKGGMLTIKLLFDEKRVQISSITRRAGKRLHNFHTFGKLFLFREGRGNSGITEEVGRAKKTGNVRRRKTRELI